MWKTVTLNFRDCTTSGTLVGQQRFSRNWIVLDYYVKRSTEKEGRYYWEKIVTLILVVPKK